MEVPSGARCRSGGSGGDGLSESFIAGAIWRLLPFLSGHHDWRPTTHDTGVNFTMVGRYHFWPL